MFFIITTIKPITDSSNFPKTWNKIAKNHLNRPKLNSLNFPNKTPTKVPSPQLLPQSQTKTSKNPPNKRKKPKKLQIF